MIEPTHNLPTSRQAELLNISRSNVYYLPRPMPAADLGLMRHIDEQGSGSHFWRDAI